MTDNPNWINSHVCLHCGKRTYSSRGVARRARGRFHRNERQMCAYRACDGVNFHLGHSDALKWATKETRSK